MYRFGSDFLKSLPLADSTLTERDIFARGVMLNVGYHVLTVLIVVIIPILTGRSKKRFFVSQILEDLQHALLSHECSGGFQALCSY